MQGQNGAAAAGASQGRTVTLEVTPADAARVAVASRMGHLTLSVISAEADAATGRGPAAAAAARPEAPAAVTWGGDVSAALRGGPKGDAPSGVLHVFEGGAEAKEYRFQ
jgi:pilus assembly protein CpaB